MKNPIKQTQKTDGGIARVLAVFIELIAWLQIVASPLLIGLIVGAIIYVSKPSKTSLVIGIVLTCIGLLIGIRWATKQWKGKGTTWFMSRINATPDLDEDDEQNENEKLNEREYK
jgi:hypothetical protein